MRALWFALLWWILTDGAQGSWPVGVPVVLLALFASIKLMPAASWSLPGIARFVPFFLWHSLRAGADVAGRALRPRMPISPALIDWPWRLPPGLPRVLMANTVSLLPGTLSAELNDACLRVHVLDDRHSFESEFLVIEARVAGLLGLDWPRQ
jgi:multicomponent Na+:H+ antiporter subunit E